MMQEFTGFKLLWFT